MADQNQNSSLSLPGLSNNEICKCAEQSMNVLRNIQSLYEAKELFDIVLIAESDNVKVHAHKIVLSASSEYFRGMFRNPMKQAKADEIKLKEIDGEILATIVHFMYTSSIELRSETAISILSAANLFGMNTLIVTCSDFICKRFDADNCLGIAFFAQQHNAAALYEKAITFAVTHFEAVCTTKEFLNLNKEQLNSLISRDDLLVSSEEKVFLSLVAWIEYDKETREMLIFDIFSQIRFTLLEPKFFIKNRHSICKTIECYELICGWLQWHMSPEGRLEFPEPRKTNEKLAFASGNHTSDLRVQIFDQDLNSWVSVDLCQPPIRKYCSRPIAINKKLFFAGAGYSCVPTNDFHCYDFQTKIWTDLPPMGSVRILAALAELNGDLYVVGGYERNYGGNWLRSVEKYDFGTGNWIKVAPMLTAFKKVQVAVLNGLLYAVGANVCTMECYDPDANQWTKKTFKNEKSTSFGFAAVSGHLYAVGGDYNEKESRTVERYHPSMDTWTNISSLRQGQTSALCTAFNNQLIISKGFDGYDFLSQVDEFNPKTSEWTTLAPLGTLSLEGPPLSLFTI